MSDDKETAKEQIAMTEKLMRDAMSRVEASNRNFVQSVDEAIAASERIIQNALNAVKASEDETNAGVGALMKRSLDSVSRILGMSEAFAQDARAKAASAMEKTRGMLGEPDSAEANAGSDSGADRRDGSGDATASDSRTSRPDP